MPKIVFIGAGSSVFFQRLMIDVLSFPALADSEFHLVDIDPKRLEYARRIGERIIKERHLPVKVCATTERKEALPGADYVIITILVGGIEVISEDINIPLKYGVDQCIGDTLGPAGVFRALRTIPVIIDICRDVERICPEALVLNYTNPMAMLCWAIEETTKVNYVGLCHSVENTARHLARYIGAPLKEISYWAAGINHQSWLLEFKWNGKDAYPLLREKIADPEIYNNDTTRFEMLKHLGYFVAEGSGHNSEYNPWFRKRKDLLRKYTRGGKWNGGTGYILQLYGTDREDYEKEQERIASGKESLDFKRSYEYGSYIINAIQTGETFRINGNVSNRGLITNLPQGCCVEVPCYVDKHGINPCFIGDLPLQLAALNKMNISVQEMAVKAALTGDKEMAYCAVAYDPLTSAVLSLEEIRNMVDEMFEAENAWFPQF